MTGREEEIQDLCESLSGNKIIWVASYPKSGNTWVRFLLANLLSGPVTSSDQMEHIVPDIHTPLEGGYAHYHGVLFFKTHWKYERVSSLNFDTMGAIYVFRNPLDVIASHINYLGLAEDEKKRNIFINNYIYLSGFPQWIECQFGTWIENIEGWVFQQKNFPCLILRYEDMKLNPLETVINICRFLGLEKTDSEMDQAMQCSSFENLGSMEEQELSSGSRGLFLTNYLSKQKASPTRFMNKGKIGNYKQLLSEGQIKLVLDRFGPVMEKLGYKIK